MSIRFERWIRSLVTGRYGRWVMLGLLIAILAGFTVMSEIGDWMFGRSQAGEAPEVAGSFAVLPGSVHEVKYADFEAASRRYGLAKAFFERAPLDRVPDTEVWTHLVLLEAARKEGIAVSAGDLRDVIERSINEHILGDPAQYRKWVLDNFGVNAATLEGALLEYLTAFRVRQLYRESIMVGPAATRKAAVDQAAGQNVEYAFGDYAALDAARFLGESEEELKSETDPEAKLREFFDKDPTVRLETERFRHPRRFRIELLYTVHKKVDTEEALTRIQNVVTKAYPEAKFKEVNVADRKTYFGTYRDRLLGMAGDSWAGVTKKVQDEAKAPDDGKENAGEGAAPGPDEAKPAEPGKPAGEDPPKEPPAKQDDPAPPPGKPDETTPKEPPAKEEPKEPGPKEDPKEPAKDEPKEPAKDEPKEPAKDEPKEPAKDEPKEPAKDEPKEPAKDEPKEPAKDEPKEPAKDEPKEPGPKPEGAQANGGQPANPAPPAPPPPDPAQNDPALGQKAIAYGYQVVKDQVGREVTVRTIYEYLHEQAKDSVSLKEMFERLKAQDDQENPVCSTEPGKGLIQYRDFDGAALSADDLQEIEDSGVKFGFSFKPRVTGLGDTDLPRKSRKADTFGDEGHGRQIFRLLEVIKEQRKTYDELTAGEKEDLRRIFFLPERARTRAKEKLEALRQRLVDGSVKPEQLRAEAETLGCRVHEGEWIDATYDLLREPDRKRLWHDEFLHMRDRHFLRRSLAQLLERDRQKQEWKAGTFLPVDVSTRREADDPGSAYLFHLRERKKPDAMTIAPDAIATWINDIRSQRLREEGARWGDQPEQIRTDFNMVFEKEMQARIDEELRQREDAKRRR